MSPIRPTVLVLASALCIAGLLPLGSTSSVVAQDAVGARTIQVDSMSVLRLYRMQYAEPQDVLMSIHDLLPGRHISINIDSRTNSLLIHGSAAAHEEVEAIIESLDVPVDTSADERGERTLSILDVRFVRDHVFLMNTIDSVLVPGERMSVSDEGMMSLFATPKTRQAVVQLIDDLIEATAESSSAAPVQTDTASRDRRVRLSWLAGGDEGLQIGRSVGADLAPVARELETFVDSVREVARTSVVANNATAFGIDALIASDAGPITFDWSGRIVRSGTDADEVELRIEASRGGANPIDVSMHTRLTVPHGTKMVLGSTPAGDLHTVFVLDLEPASAE